MHILEKGPHGLSFSNQASVQARSQVYPSATKWVEVWLEDKLGLQLPELTSWEMMNLDKNIIKNISKHQKKIQI